MRLPEVELRPFAPCHLAAKVPSSIPCLAGSRSCSRAGLVARRRRHSSLASPARRIRSTSRSTRCASRRRYHQIVLSSPSYPNPFTSTLYPLLLSLNPQASHVKNKVAKKEAKDEAKAAAAELSKTGNELALDAEGKGVVPLSDGREYVSSGFQPSEPSQSQSCRLTESRAFESRPDRLPVRGAWGSDASDGGKPTILCIHDFGHDASQFDGLIAALDG